MSLSGKGRLFAATLTVVALSLSAACSGSDDSATPAGDSGQSGQNGFAAYQECLRNNGVTLPSAGAGGARPSGAPTARPSGGPTARPSARPDASAGAGRGGPGMGRPDGVDEATWEKAQEACASVRPSGGPDGDGGPGARPSGSGAPNGGQGDGRSAAYRTCLSNRGVDLDSLDSGDTKTTEALAACAAVSPSPAS
ncbi:MULTISPECIES: hypothetical protein [unclassified Micromonospora]|uniref:hypothetical protein n=1 Tax=unclassified Micromonospora TaxID=2617518 RepID=UPI003644993C